MFNAGVRGKRSKDSTGILTVGEHFNQQQYLIPTVTRFAVTDGSYVDTNDTAADTAGNQTIVLYGSGFAPGATVLVGSTTIGVVTFLDSGRLAFTSPALGSGSYTVFVTNANGGTGILVPGLVYSGVPTFTTAAGSLGTVYETTAISTSVVATGDAPITYALSSGSLPSGSTLSSGGTISGTAPVDGSSTTYSFTVQATDAQNQDSVRSFTLTITTDVVSFSSPANNTTTTVTQNSPISNVTVVGTSAAGYGVLYTSSGLPTGLSMNTSTGIISGTPTVVASNTSVITATANTTSRSATLYLNWTVNLPGDLFWKYASLLLSANTVPNGNTFNTDTSTFNNEIIVVADTKPNKFHPFVEGYYSNFFNGSSILSISSAQASAPFTFGTGDFTIEAWSWASQISTATTIFDNRTGITSLHPVFLAYATSGQLAMYVAGATAIAGPTIPLNRWVHLALVRQSGVTKMYMDGQKVGNDYTDTNNYAASGAVGWGGATYAVTNYTTNGYMSNLRVVKGTAVYTANTTPPTSPLTAIANTILLTAQSNKFVDTSNNNWTIALTSNPSVNSFNPFNGTPTTVTVPAANNYSMYFDGTGDYLTVPSNAALTIGTSSATVEFWIYPTAVDSYRRVISSTNSTFTSGTFCLRYNNSSTFALVAATNTIVASSIPPVNTWSHVAWVGVGGTSQTLYINGVNVGTAGSYNYTEAIQYIGGYYSVGPAEFIVGYMSNVRVLKGTALYTTGFTPPTAPLTAIANTSLLTCQANTVIDNSNNAVAITTNGNATPARNGPFANTSTVTLVGNEGSAYFDGTGDYLDAASANTSGIFAFGTADYTLEAWIYPTATTAGMRVFEFSGNQDNIGINQTSTGTIDYYNGTTSTTSAAGLVVVNTWTHIALVRQSGTAKVYVNGVLAVTQASTPNTTVRALWIGGRNNTVFQGYMSNVRVTKGTALYTTPFVPTWAPLAPVANTVLLTTQTNLSSNTKVMIDESSSAGIVSGNGNANLGSFSPFGNSWSVYFDGTGDYLSGSSSRLNFGANDFTVEFWMWPVNVSTNSQIIFQAGSGNFAILLMTGGIIEPGQYQTSLISDSTAVITAGAWHHVVVTRTGTAFRTIINGVLRGYGTRSFSPNNSSYTIGGAATGTAYTGYISNFRVFANNIPTLYSTSSTTLATTIFTTPTDPFVVDANTVLLTCNSNKFVDYSAANNVITRTGDTAVSKFSPFSSLPVTPASYSGYFDGTGDYLSVPSNAAFALPGDFTVESWLYVTSFAAERTIIDLRGATSTVGFLGAIAITTGYPFIYKESTGTILTSSTAVTLNAWTHVAFVRSRTTLVIYVNGVNCGSTTDSTSWSAPNTTGRIGANKDAGAVMLGYISNLRVVKGTAVYTGTFTPSTTPLTAVANTVLLTCQSTSFVDTSNNAFAITVNGAAKPVIQNPFTDTVGAGTNYSANTFGNSIYFDGTTDYLTIPYDSKFNIPASTPFTFECWVYTTSTNIFVVANRNWSFGSTGATWGFSISNGTQPTWAIGGTGSSTYNMVAAGLPGPLGSWNHYAWTRDSNNVCRVFTNGVEAVASTRTDSQAMTSASGNIFVGVSSNLASAYGNGYVSGIRFVNGSCLYTSSFIPSRQPLLPVANTVLLLAGTSGPSVTDAIRISDMETTGTARQVANNSPYYDTYSGYFDGSGDYITTPITASGPLDLGNGDWTMECWAYYAGASLTTAARTFLSLCNNSGIPYIQIGTKASTGYVLVEEGNNITVPWRAEGTTLFTSNVWHHVAAVRRSNVIYIYLDGVQQTTTASKTDAHQTFARVQIGSLFYNAASIQDWNGYVSNVRIVKGLAVYTGNFTVPTSPLAITQSSGTNITAITGTQTSLLACQSNRFIDNSTNAFTFTKAADAKISAFQPFVSNNTSRFTSVYFPAKTDYLAVKPQPNLITFPGDFTAECWVYPSDSTITYFTIWDARSAGASAVPMLFQLAPLASAVAGSYRMAYYNGTYYYGTTTVIYNQWTHLAWVRSGSTLTYYVNGVAGGTATISGTQTGTATAAAPIYIGSKDNGLAGYGTTGYLADFRITNGYARTITVPTAPYDVK